MHRITWTEKRKFSYIKYENFFVVACSNVQIGIDMEIYIVKANDTVDLIAKQFEVTTEVIIFDNQLIAPYELAVGQALYINKGEMERNRSIFTNGYAYPFISTYVLKETLPYLTWLSVFSYGFTGEGELLSPLWDDVPMIKSAIEFGVIPALTLTPFGPNGAFSNELISAIVNNESAIQRLIEELLSMMSTKGFKALDIDFEYIKKEDREAFVAFVTKITAAMNEKGYQVSVALAPKTSKDQTGLLYEGKDYEALGKVANQVLIMTYEWGYTYGPPMAVSPIPSVKKVLDYAVTAIPKEKITMGIPNYGYDWPLPFEKGTTKAKTIGNVEAVRLAIKYGVPIQFDEESQSPFFQYTEDNVIHEVWFEDARSIQAKLNLIEEYGIKGAGYWQIMQLFRVNWLVTEARYKIEKQ